MLLQLDAGNTRLKWRLLERGVEGVLARGALVRADFESNTLLLARLSAELLLIVPEKSLSLSSVAVASVAGAEFDDDLVLWSRCQYGMDVEFAVVTARAAGVEVGYDSPALLGVDRWLAVLAASKEPGFERIIIADCGSAITVDILDTGVHRGGYIVPGLRLMHGALFDETSQVRVAASTSVTGDAPGRSTAEAVQRGVLLMAAAFIERLCRRLAGEGEGCLLLLTGGDSSAIAVLLEVDVVVRQRHDLVLDGLALSEFCRKA